MDVATGLHSKKVAGIEGLPLKSTMKFALLCGVLNVIAAILCSLSFGIRVTVAGWRLRNPHFRCGFRGPRFPGAVFGQQKRVAIVSGFYSTYRARGFALAISPGSLFCRNDRLGRHAGAFDSCSAPYHSSRAA